MKMAGYDVCREAIERCRLKEPRVWYQVPIVFDPDMLMEVRDRFGYDLYVEVMKDIRKDEGWENV